MTKVYLSRDQGLTPYRIGQLCIYAVLVWGLISFVFVAIALS